MPYIKQQDRDELDFRSPKNCGELNYEITRLMLSYVKHHGLSYTVGNEVMGAIECAKIEFYRRLLAPYEDQKAFENGDLY